MSTKKKTTKKVKTPKDSKPEGWPNKRNVFFRPERMKYVRKLIKNEGCVFCKAASSDISFDTLCVYKTKYTQVIINKYPYNNGHILVLPLAHIGNILELSPERYDDLHRTLRLTVEAVQEIYQPNGFNIGMNHGAAAGAGIPEHLHYHIVPRWRGDLNFFPLIAETKVVIESLDISYQKIFDFFKKAQVDE